MSAAGRTPAAAVGAYLGELQRALSCVSDQVLVATGYRPEDGPHRLGPARGADVSLTADEPLRLRLGLGYQVAPAPEPQTGFRVFVRSYAYILVRADDQELFAYHWHPTGPSATRWPHLHVGPAIGARPPYSGAHLPTGGTVSLAEILRAAVLDLGVRPRRHDWREILAAPGDV